MTSTIELVHFILYSKIRLFFNIPLQLLRTTKNNNFSIAKNLLNTPFNPLIAIFNPINAQGFEGNSLWEAYLVHIASQPTYILFHIIDFVVDVGEVCQIGDLLHDSLHVDWIKKFSEVAHYLLQDLDLPLDPFLLQPHPDNQHELGEWHQWHQLQSDPRAYFLLL